MAETEQGEDRKTVDATRNADDGRFRVLLVLGIAAGIAAGIIGAILWSGRSDDIAFDEAATDSTFAPGAVVTEPPTSVELDPDAQLATAAQFLNAWRTSRSVEAVVSYDERRESEGGSTISASGLLVQAPPQRLESHYGSVEGILDGAPATCEPSVDGPRVCRRSTTGSGDFAAQINTEIDNLRLLFTTSPATYRILLGDPGCYSLTLLVEVGGGPFGRTASLCFDEATGVLTRSEVVFGGGVTETKTATSIKPSATAADFDTILAL